MKQIFRFEAQKVLFTGSLRGEIMAERFGSAGRFGLGREIWLSPVIQATWEERKMGLFEGE
jgi:hypothetical protein